MLITFCDYKNPTNEFSIANVYCFYIISVLQKDPVHMKCAL